MASRVADRDAASRRVAMSFQVSDVHGEPPLSTARLVMVLTTAASDDFNIDMFTYAGLECSVS